MRCPVCGGEAVRAADGAVRVFDSRVTREHVRRRRFCASCGGRFTTIETPVYDLPPALVRVELEPGLADLAAELIGRLAEAEVAGLDARRGRT